MKLLNATLITVKYIKNSKLDIFFINYSKISVFFFFCQIKLNKGKNPLLKSNDSIINHKMQYYPKNTHTKIQKYTINAIT